MNAERLHVIAKAVRDDLSRTELTNTLKQLVTSLQNQVNQPNQPQYQQQVSSTLTTLYQALENSPSNDFPPTWRQALSELGGDGLLGIELRTRIQEIFSRNQITPSVALGEITPIHKTVSTLEEAFDSITTAFSQLSIGSDDIEPGYCELGILIPRLFVNNNLAEFGEEIIELNQILGVFAEISTGSRPDFKIRTVSSSDLNVFLDSLPEIGACLAVAVERLVALYKTLLEIRKLNNELKSQGVPVQQLEGVELHATKVMDDGIDKLIPEIMKQYYKRSDAGRKNELTTELKISLKKLAARIDRGYNFEVRVKSVPASSDQDKTGESAESSEHITRIQQSAKALQFIKQTGDPILSLPDGRPKKGQEKKKHSE